MITVVSFFRHDFDNERCRQKLWMMVVNVTRSRYRRASQYVFRMNAWRRIEFVNRENVIYYTELYASTELVSKGSDNLQLCRVNKEVSYSIVNNVCNSLLISMSSDFLSREFTLWNFILTLFWHFWENNLWRFQCSEDVWSALFISLKFPSWELYSSYTIEMKSDESRSVISCLKSDCNGFQSVAYHD